jgi:predicted GNAT family acetyltransferase
VEIRRFDSDAAAFYARAGAFLEAREAQHNLVLGLRTRLLRNLQLYAPQDPYLATAEHDGRVVGVALRTPPHFLILSAVDDRGAIDAFADDLRGTTLPGVSGPVDAAERFAERWRETTGLAVASTMPQGIYEATEVVAPDGVRGSLRDYEERDREQAVAWMRAFEEEARPPGPLGDAGEFVDRRAADPDGGLVVWDDGGAVSLAGFGSPTPSGIRVGPVYTPPEQRGRGYAGALTAALTARLLASGRRACFLFTDLANPTSNALYQRIGYHRVGDVTLLTFGLA